MAKKPTKKVAKKVAMKVADPKPAKVLSRDERRVEAIKQSRKQ